MATVTEMGRIITPPLPAFYQSKTSQDDLVGHKVGRILDLLGVASEGLVARWRGLGSPTGEAGGA